jgi:hypothetical protein
VFLGAILPSCSNVAHGAGDGRRNIKATKGRMAAMQCPEEPRWRQHRVVSMRRVKLLASCMWAVQVGVRPEARNRSEVVSHPVFAVARSLVDETTRPMIRQIELAPETFGSTRTNEVRLGKVGTVLCYCRWDVTGIGGVRRRLLFRVLTAPASHFHLHRPSCSCSIGPTPHRRTKSSSMLPRATQGSNLPH